MLEKIIQKTLQIIKNGAEKGANIEQQSETCMTKTMPKFDADRGGHVGPTLGIFRGPLYYVLTHRQQRTDRQTTRQTDRWQTRTDGRQKINKRKATARARRRASAVADIYIYIYIYRERERVNVVVRRRSIVRTTCPSLVVVQSCS